MKLERIASDCVKNDKTEKEHIRVLLIEDEPNFAQLVIKRLNKSTSARFDVEWADCLSKALNLLNILKTDLVILDLNLPDSREADTFVSVQEHAPDTPIIILTAEDDETIALKLIQLGADSYMIKSETRNTNLGRHVLHSFRRFKVQNQRQKGPVDTEKGAQFRNALDKSADGIVITNNDGYVLYVNSAAEFLFGRNEKEMVGSQFGFPLVTEDKTEVNIIHKSGASIVMEMRIVMVEWQGEPAYLASLRDVTVRKKNEEMLYNLSITDDLTGLHNRRGFFNLAERYLAEAGHAAEFFLVLFIDLDGLKTINDTLGHLNGSQALIDTAEVIRETFRDSDILARFGGDEFVILVKNAQMDYAEILMRRLQKNAESYSRNEKRPYVLSLSVGAANYDPSKPSTIEDLVNNADRSMYTEKRTKHTRSSKFG